MHLLISQLFVRTRCSVLKRQKHTARPPLAEYPNPIQRTLEYLSQDVPVLIKGCYRSNAFDQVG
jgi:hypothetical protein